MRLNLLEFFKNLQDENYCIIKDIEIIDYKKGSDIDIFCFNLNSFSKKILAISNKYISKGYTLSINNERELHWHIDFLKDNKIEIRFDLYGAMPSYKNVLIKDALFSSVVENRVIKEMNNVKIYHQSIIDEALIKYLEYLENYKLRPDKVKHLDYILKNVQESDKKKFLDKLHYYTKLPQVLDLKSESDLIRIFKETIPKIKATPINKLPKKIINFLKHITR
jgi:hypothetical protein